MRIEGQNRSNVSIQTNPDSVEGKEAAKEAKNAELAAQDSIEPFQGVSLTAQAEQAPPAAPAGDEGGVEWYDFVPFGVGNWFDGEGTFATDLGRQILSVVCPIPFVGGLLADWGGDWLGNALADVAEWTTGAIGDAAEWTWDAAGDAAGAVGGVVEDAAEAVGDVVEDVADAVGDAAGDVVDAIGDVFSW